MLKEFDCKLITGTINGVFKADLMCFLSKIPKKMRKLNRNKSLGQINTDSKHVNLYPR